MNAFAQQLLGVAKGYLGPAAQTLLATEFHALGVNANTIGPAQLEGLVERVRVKAARAMGDERAAELASRLADCGTSAKPTRSAHRLAKDAAAKLLESGRARHAEIAYKALVEKHGDTESYCGLARAQAALEDEAAGLATLRDGAAKFAQRGDRASAVTLLVEAVAIVPSDLAAHRRLAAALANQGDLPSAIAEYARFVDMALAQRDTRRAWLELAYGRETLGDLPGLLAIVDRLAAASGGSAGPAPRTAPVPPIIARSELAPRPSSVLPPSPTAVSRPAPLPANVPATPFEAPLVFEPRVRPATPAAPRATPSAAAATPATSAASATPAASAKAQFLRERLHSAEPRTRAAAGQTTVVLTGASTVTHAVQVDLGGPTDLLARAGLSKNGHTPAARPRPPRPPIDLEPLISALVPAGGDLDAASIAATRATLLIGLRDKRATDATTDAARRLLSLGKLQSASDVLLDYVAHGFTDREAQRLLIEVACAVGRRDTARQKCQLLAYAYRLDGQADVAADVDRIARIL